MKYKNLLLALGASVFASNLASAQNPAIVVSESRLTLALTFEYQANGLSPIDSNGKKVLGPRVLNTSYIVDKSRPADSVTDTKTYSESKQDGLKFRYGNKEFLTDLVTQGIITSVDGYYISIFSNAQGQPYAIYLRNAITNAVPVRLDNTYITFDLATAQNTTDRYSYKGQHSVYTNTASNKISYVSNGTKTLTTQYPFTITTSRFPTAPTGRIRLETKAKTNTGAAAATWIVSSIKSTGVILSGTRSAINDVGAAITPTIQVDGTLTGAAGVGYTALPTGISGT